MGKSILADEFAADSSANWTSIDGGDTFTVNSPAGMLKMADTGGNDRMLLLHGTTIGPVDLSTSITFPAGTANGDEAGFVFGYKSASNYWLLSLAPFPDTEN